LQLFVAAAVALPLVAVAFGVGLLLQLLLLLVVAVGQLTAVVESTASVVEIVVAVVAESLYPAAVVESLSVTCSLLSHQERGEHPDQEAMAARSALSYLTACFAALLLYWLVVP